MSDVAARLRQWYGIELRVSDSVLASRHLRASFAGETPAQIARIIGQSLGGDAELRGDTIIVRRSREATPPR
jgi:hypothetical protein